MSGHTYDELPTLIAKLKRARIDAWMRQDGWTVADDEYTYIGGGMYGGELHVSRPGADGEGGGKYWATGAAVIPHDQEDDYTTAFGTIRSAVDEHLNPWINPKLPDPTNIRKWWTPLRDASVQIAAQATLNGTITGGGAMDGLLKEFIDDCDKNSWKGATAETFRTNYLTQLPSAVAANHAVLAFLAAQVDAQRQMWTNARQGVVDVVVETTKAYDRVQGGPGFDWNLAFKIAGFAVAAFSVWASGGATAVVAAGAAKVGVDVVTEIHAQVTKQDQPDPGTSYEDVRDGMPKALENLNSAILKEEREMLSDLKKVYDAVTGIGAKRPGGQGRMAGSRDTFNLKRPTLLNIDDDSDVSADTVFADPTTLKNAVDVTLHQIVTRLHDADTLIYPLSVKDPWADFDRDYSIGLGDCAVMWDWCNVAVLLDECLADLKKECSASGEVILLLLRDLKGVDVGSSESLKHQAKQDAHIGVGGVDYQRAKDTAALDQSILLR